MEPSQPLPRLWMMTDERQGERLWEALGRLPADAGIVFRHYSLAEPERRAVFARVAEGRKGPVLLAGSPRLARQWGADGSHGWEGASDAGLLRSVSVHDREEMERANKLGADLAFVSPIFATRSHPGGTTLGPEGLRALVAEARMPVIALGGMDAARAEALGECGIQGWAAIDAWTRT